MGGEIPPMNNKKKGFYYMGKIYFIADTKIGEESMQRHRYMSLRMITIIDCLPIF